MYFKKKKGKKSSRPLSINLAVSRVEMEVVAPGGPRHRRTVASLRRLYNEAAKRKEIIANKST